MPVTHSEDVGAFISRNDFGEDAIVLGYSPPRHFLIVLSFLKNGEPERVIFEPHLR